MVNLWDLLIVVSLLVLSAPQRCSGEDLDSLDLGDVKLLTAMQMVNEALKNMSDTIEESNRLHEKKSAEMEDTLSQEIAEVKNLLGKNDKFENEELKKQLEIRDKEVDALSQEIARQKLQLDNKEILVQVLVQKIVDYQKREQQLNETLARLKIRMAAQKCGDSVLESQPRQEDIIRLVQQYNTTKDWYILQTGLETVLDRNSEPYMEVESIEYIRRHPMWDVAGYNRTHLLSLLLDAGLPVDTTDPDGGTMLHGAAFNGHLNLVKLLLCHGASVDTRTTSDETPFIYAAMGGRLEVVKHLVSAGADTTARTKSRKTALDYASEFDKPDVALYLQQLAH